MRRDLLLALGLAAIVAAVPCAAQEYEWLERMPEAVSNNAVSLVDLDGQVAIASFMGLGPDKTHDAIHSRAWAWLPGTGQWQRLPDVPGSAGRLAGVAVQVGGAAWLFGGYTVAPDGHEVSTPRVYRWTGGAWDSPVAMPVPVDDATAHVYQDRYVYLVSGWHDLGNVNLVQVLDTQSLEWAMATPYPGAPVFGHAGGMAGRQLLVCDGVRIDYPADGGARRFVPSNECWLGEVDADNHRRIGWRPVAPHPGRPRYRMAAGSDGRRIVFAGGTDNPYNYDGVGYDGVPSRPDDAIFSFNPRDLSWKTEGRLPAARMDHRGLPYLDGWFYVLGGMTYGQHLTSTALRFRLER